MTLQQCPLIEGEPTEKPSLEVADIFRSYGEQYQRTHPIPFECRKAMHNIQNCRTAVMGGHKEECDACGFERNAYNSCGDRHCPKCRVLAKEKWLDERKAELLPTGYFHMVFTLVHELNPLILCNKTKMLDMFFESVNEVLRTFAKDPQWRLQGELGFIAVLHTWNQTLLDHFHLHCLIPAGALSFDQTQWIPSRENFLFRTESLAKELRKQMIRKLRRAFDNQELIFPGNTAPMGNPEGFEKLIDQIAHKDWIVYAKRPFAGPQQVLEYLGRYTHRVAISNERIRSIEGGEITFTYRDRNDENQVKEMTLDSDEFIRRFLLHILPKGFVKIRYFGFLSHRRKTRSIPLIRRLIDPDAKPPQRLEETVREMMLRLTGEDITICPQCQKGRMVYAGELPKAFNLYGRAKGIIYD